MAPRRTDLRYKWVAITKVLYVCCVYIDYCRKTSFRVIRGDYFRTLAVAHVVRRSATSLQTASAMGHARFRDTAPWLVRALGLGATEL